MSSRILQRRRRQVQLNVDRLEGRRLLTTTVNVGGTTGVTLHQGLIEVNTAGGGTVNVEGNLNETGPFVINSGVPVNIVGNGFTLTDSVAGFQSNGGSLTIADLSVTGNGNFTAPVFFAKGGSNVTLDNVSFSNVNMDPSAQQGVFYVAGVTNVTMSRVTLDHDVDTAGSVVNLVGQMLSTATVPSKFNVDMTITNCTAGQSGNGFGVSVLSAGVTPGDTWTFTHLAMSGDEAFGLGDADFYGAGVVTISNASIVNNTDGQATGGGQSPFTGKTALYAEGNSTADGGDLSVNVTGTVSGNVATNTASTNPNFQAGEGSATINFVALPAASTLAPTSTTTATAQPASFSLDLRHETFALRRHHGQPVLVLQATAAQSSGRSHTVVVTAGRDVLVREYNNGHVTNVPVAQGTQVTLILGALPMESAIVGFFRKR